MTERVTAKTVERQLPYLETAARDAGVLDETARLALQVGSPTNGRAWRLHEMREGESGLYTTRFASDYLGWTAAEALNILHAIRRALEACAS